jgi:hypothetical protein
VGSGSFVGCGIPTIERRYSLRPLYTPQMSIRYSVNQSVTGLALYRPFIATGLALYRPFIGFWTDTKSAPYLI